MRQRSPPSDLTQPHHSARRDELGDLLRSLRPPGTRSAALVSQVRSSTATSARQRREIASGQDLSAHRADRQQPCSRPPAPWAAHPAPSSRAPTPARQSQPARRLRRRVGSRAGTVVAGRLHHGRDQRLLAQDLRHHPGTIDGIAFRPTSWRSTPPWKPRAPASRAAASPSSPARCTAWPSVRQKPPARWGPHRAPRSRGRHRLKLVADAGSTMGEIVASVQRVTDIIGEITRRRLRQSDGIGGPTPAVTQLDQMTQQNAALVERSPPPPIPQDQASGCCR